MSYQSPISMEFLLNVDSVYDRNRLQRFMDNEHEDSIVIEEVLFFKQSDWQCVYITHITHSIAFKISYRKMLEYLNNMKNEEPAYLNNNSPDIIEHPLKTNSGGSGCKCNWCDG